MDSCVVKFILIPSGNHAKDIKSCSFLGWNIDPLIFELPPVRYITIGTHMAFIGVIEVYLAVYVQMFKFLQLLFLINTKVTITLEQ